MAPGCARLVVAGGLFVPGAGWSGPLLAWLAGRWGGWLVGWLVVGLLVWFGLVLGGLLWLGWPGLGFAGGGWVLAGFGWLGWSGWSGWSGLLWLDFGRRSPGFLGLSLDKLFLPLQEATKPS